MNKLLASAIPLLLVLGLAQDARAQNVPVDVAPFIGYGLDVPNQVSDPGSMSVGALAHVHLRLNRIALILNPDFEYYLFDVNGVTGFQLNGNVLLAIGTRRSVIMPYAGLGLAFSDVTATDTDPSDGNSGFVKGAKIGLNLIGGFAFGRAPARPFFQGRYTIGKHELHRNDAGEASSGFSVQGGILFRL